MSDVKNVIFLFIRAQMADSGPPLGTVLGNIGINATKFCKDFNEFTKELPVYFLLKVKISILEDRSYSFMVFLPTTGLLLSLLRTQFIIRVNSKDVKKPSVSLKNLVQLAKFKFPYLSLYRAMCLVLGSARSCGFIIIR